MKKLLFAIALFCVFPIKGNSQVIGTWSSSTTSTYTTDAIGIGTNIPDGWQEIKYCSSTQKGLIVTKENCPGNGMYPFLPGFGGGHLPDINPPFFVNLQWTEENFYSHIPVLLNYSPVFTNPSNPFLSSMSYSPTNLYSNQQPLLVVKVSESQLPGNPTGTKFIVTPDGRVGINMPSPRAPLDLRGSQDFNVPLAMFGINATNGTNFTKNILISANLGNRGYNDISQNGDLGMFFTDGGNSSNDGSNSTGALVIAPWSKTPGVGGLRMSSNGNVEMRGDLRCTKVVVNARWWPDFVFENNYSLMPLDSLDAYIKTNGHLPGIPSQDSVVSNGQDIGEIQKLQQQKIEELTLYIIDQQKMLKQLIDKLNEQKLNSSDVKN